MREFNLEEALAGGKLVTRTGDYPTDFKFDDDGDTTFPYSAILNNSVRGYTEAGLYWIDEESNRDLFMAEDGIVVNSGWQPVQGEPVEVRDEGDEPDAWKIGVFVCEYDGLYFVQKGDRYKVTLYGYDQMRELVVEEDTHTIKIDVDINVDEAIQKVKDLTNRVKELEKELAKLNYPTHG